MKSKMKESDPILEVENLSASTDNLPILKGVSLTVYPGEIHAIMGRNGCGKSTLSKIIAGHPSYNITNGDIKFLGENINSLEPEERSQSGIFLGFQYPIEIPGVSNLEFLRVSTNARRKFLHKEELDTFDFEELVKEKLEIVKKDHAFLSRSVNQGFSGGEKKRNEIYSDVLNSDIEYVISECSNKIIDEIGISKSNELVLDKSIGKIYTGNEKVYVDHFKIYNYSSVSLIRGEDNSKAIALASIIAKVHRDNIMKDLSIHYPNYLFEKNKGYGTKEHRENLKKFGISDVHRKSFNLLPK